MVLEEHTERIQTTVGATQDVAAIAKVVASHKAAILAFVLGCVLALVAVEQWRREWWLASILSGIGSVVCFYTMNPLWALAAVGGSLLVFLAFQFAKATNPVVGAVASVAEQSLRPPPAPPRP